MKFLLKREKNAKYTTQRNHRGKASHFELNAA